MSKLQRFFFVATLRYKHQSQCWRMSALPSKHSSYLFHIFVQFVRALSMSWKSQVSFDVRLCKSLDRVAMSNFCRWSNICLDSRAYAKCPNAFDLVPKPKIALMFRAMEISRLLTHCTCCATHHTEFLIFELTPNVKNPFNLVQVIMLLSWLWGKPKAIVPVSSLHIF